jgi:hypothetical protein
MIKTASVERTTKYSLTKQELEKLILHEINPSMDDGVASHVKVNFEYSISGGYDCGYDDYNHSSSSRWEPYVFSGVTITVTEKS